MTYVDLSKLNLV